MGAKTSAAGSFTITVHEDDIRERGGRQARYLYDWTRNDSSAGGERGIYTTGVGMIPRRGASYTVIRFICGQSVVPCIDEFTAGNRITQSSLVDVLKSVHGTKGNPT